MTSIAQRRPLALATLSTGFVVLWLFLAAFPFLWTLWGSFKVEADFFSKEHWEFAVYGTNTIAKPGSAFTGEGYEGAWVQERFWRAVINTTIVTFFVVIISLTFGTLGGYALARSNYRYTFWLLIAALVFRAMPHITLVSGYLLPFFEMNVWGYLPTAIYGCCTLPFSASLKTLMKAQW
jgi:ABC-type glycerol-3-phosphate transport system permease component